MASSNSTANPDEFFEYNELVWGDLIHGTKHLLQKIGIGIGMAFPGEEGGPKRTLNVIDPRGFRCRIRKSWHSGPDIFCASIQFPGREKSFGVGDWEYFSPGIQRKEMFWTDDFMGTAEALVAAGLVPAGYFPGFPGMRKTRVTILPNGSLPQGSEKNHGAGTKLIERCAGKKYRLSVTIPDELGEQRLALSWRADEVWEAKMKSLPRPPRIDGPLRLARSQAADVRRSALRLIWSRPKFVPQFNIPPQGPFAR
ncbi:hypothetical protein [Ferribacterium limneticum]|uniref:hypothetical protein n=1 Tax=Ferribacterium limneticum TaxID=76259 RepID=UPI001CF821CD|nr:hypothetical protein [Ferribacterium limneticum]UCV22045.1 hypothetical protein KI613_16155 [Ferribacterium limneticum]